MKTVWLALKNADMTEGRGPMVTIAAFNEQRDATRAVTGWGVMGVGDGDVEPLLVYDSFNEYNEKKLMERRNKALAKLTREDREVLGIR